MGGRCSSGPALADTTGGRPRQSGSGSFANFLTAAPPLNGSREVNHTAWARQPRELVLVCTTFLLPSLPLDLKPARSMGRREKVENIGGDGDVTRKEAEGNEINDNYKKQ